jgi:hypothetical protein
MMACFYSVRVASHMSDQGTKLITSSTIILARRLNFVLWSSL